MTSSGEVVVVRRTQLVGPPYLARGAQICGRRTSRTCIFLLVSFGIAFALIGLVLFTADLDLTTGMWAGGMVMMVLGVVLLIWFLTLCCAARKEYYALPPAHPARKPPRPAMHPVATSTPAYQLLPLHNRGGTPAHSPSLGQSDGFVDTNESYIENTGSLISQTGTLRCQHLYGKTGTPQTGSLLRGQTGIYGQTGKTGTPQTGSLLRGQTGIYGQTGKTGTPQTGSLLRGQTGIYSQTGKTGNPQTGIYGQTGSLRPTGSPMRSQTGIYGQTGSLMRGTGTPQSGSLMRGTSTPQSGSLLRVQPGGLMRSGTPQSGNMLRGQTVYNPGNYMEGQKGGYDMGDTSYVGTPVGSPGRQNGSYLKNDYGHDKQNYGYVDKPTEYRSPTEYRDGYRTPTAPTEYRDGYRTPTEYRDGYSRPTAPTEYRDGYSRPTEYREGYRTPTENRDEYSRPTEYNREGYKSPTEYREGFKSPSESYTAQRNSYSARDENRYNETLPVHSSPRRSLYEGQRQGYSPVRQYYPGSTVDQRYRSSGYNTDTTSLGSHRSSPMPHLQEYPGDLNTPEVTHGTPGSRHSLGYSQGHRQSRPDDQPPAYCDLIPH